jgi:hypothetical protein
MNAQWTVKMTRKGPWMNYNGTEVEDDLAVLEVKLDDAQANDVMRAIGLSIAKLNELADEAR